MEQMEQMEQMDKIDTIEQMEQVEQVEILTSTLGQFKLQPFLYREQLFHPSGQGVFLPLQRVLLQRVFPRFACVACVACVVCVVCVVCVTCVVIR